MILWIRWLGGTASLRWAAVQCISSIRRALRRRSYERVTIGWRSEPADGLLPPFRAPMAFGGDSNGGKTPAPSQGAAAQAPVLTGNANAGRSFRSTYDR